MTKLFVFGAALMLLDVFPGGGCACASPTLAGPCQSTCDCNASMNAPIKCPGSWACNAQKTCQYSCFESCQDDGGCVTAGKTCSDSFCKSPVSCP